MEEILIKAAMEAQRYAYSPYSEYCVGAALLTSEGKVFRGCNIENASFGATNCAERTAIFTGIHDGAKEIKAIALIGDINNYTFPCGICRQVMAEFINDPKTPVIIVKNENDYIIKTFEEISPGVFSKKDLDN